MPRDSERLYRLTRDLFLSIGTDGTVLAWQSRRSRPMAVDADLLSLLLRFGDGRTRAEAAQQAGIEDDESVEAAVDSFLEYGMLEACPTFAASVSSPQPDIARRRIAALADMGTFEEISGDGIITGLGQVDGRVVAFVACEPGGTGFDAITKLQDRARSIRCPIVYLLDRFYANADDEQRFASPDSVGRIYANMASLSGQVPQLCAIYGDLFRPAAFPPGLCDIVVLLATAHVHIGEPGAVHQFTRAVVTAAELGGAAMHATVSGLADAVVETEREAHTLLRQFLGYLPASSSQPPPRDASRLPDVSAASLDTLVPEDTSKPFDIVTLARGIVDGGSLLELRLAWAGEMITAFARVDGAPIGIVANQSQRRAGAITPQACDKAARFLELCQAYRIPVLFLVDTPGFAIGRQAERDGMVSAAGRLFRGLARLDVPRITVVVRNAHSAGLYAMCGPPFAPDAFLALPTATISVFGARANLPADLERQLPTTSRGALRRYLDAQRPLIDVIRASEVRNVLTARLNSVLGIPAD